ncbi:unnamed protein product [Dibothriocephalus latus]|uniref:EF-hand domain-containing protein n=1 Tax=Dibothriocephalus latus TaxID=60516 RepID=A0A3P7NHT2_DIBLA|nr:unnamed protein product [Dibothriocephalus latus]
MNTMDNLSNITAEFEAIDVDHDGYITRPELQKYVDRHDMDPDTVEMAKETTEFETSPTEVLVPAIT